MTRAAAMIGPAASCNAAKSTANLAPPQPFSARQHARARERVAHDAVRSGGMPLDAMTRMSMESMLGHSFGDVRIHLDGRTTAAAQGLRAKAYAIGSDIGFAPGKYRPDNSEGRALLAHELAHVVQQRGGDGAANEAELEHNADRAKDSARKGVAYTGPFGRSEPRIARDDDGTKAPTPPDLVEYPGPGGTKITVTRAEFERLKQQAITQLRNKLSSVEQYANTGRGLQQGLVDPYQGKIESLGDLVSNPKAIFAIAVDMHAGIKPPYIGMWDHPVHLAQLGRAALDKGDLREGATDLQSAWSAYQQCQSEWNAYLSATLAGGEKLIAQLEIVRDVSFGIALAAGAAIAAPVIAAGVAGAGLTGAVGVGATGLITGGIVSVGGAGLYGGAAAIGSAATHGGKVDTAGVISEAKRGLKDGFVTGLSAGVASGAGRALGLGAQGLSKGAQMARGAIASGAADSISGMVNAGLQGKGAGDVLKAGGIGLGTGLVSGALGAGIKGPVLSKLAATAMGAGGGALATYASGGTQEEIIVAAASGGASALALSSATPVQQATQDKAFALGRSGARQARGVLAAAMMGTANAFPPAKTSGGPDFGKPTPALVVGAHADQPVPGARPPQPADVDAPHRAPTPPAHVDAADAKPAVPPVHPDAVDPKRAPPPVHAAAADPKPAAPPVHPDVDPKPAAAPAHPDAADSKAASSPQSGGKRWRAAVEAVVDSAFGPDGATLPQAQADAPGSGHADPAAPKALPSSTAAPAPGGGNAPGQSSAGPAKGAAGSQPKYMEQDQAQNRPWSNVKILDALKQHIRNYRRNSGIPRVDLPETAGVPVEGGTVAVAKTDIPNLQGKVFGGASPEAIPERLKGKPGTTASLLEPANPLSTNHAEAVALENLARELMSQMGSTSRPDLKGRRVWVLVEQEPCASCASGIGSNAPAGPIKAFSEMFPDLIVEVHSTRSSRSYFIQNGKPVPGTQ